MQLKIRTLKLSPLALALLAWIPLALEAGQAAASPREVSAQAAAQETATAQGELGDVNATAKTLSLKTSANTMEFRYDDNTKISGAQKGVAGLATMAGTPLTVHYRKDGTVNHAVAIEVSAKAPRP